MSIDIITDLLIDFDEMGFAPTTLVPDPEGYAIKWRAEITKALEDYFKQSEGEWKPIMTICNRGACSECDEVGAVRWKYCPNCGAKMKGA